MCTTRIRFTLFIFILSFGSFASGEEPELMKKCRPVKGTPAIRINISPTVSRKLCGLIHSGKENSLYFFEKYLLKELGRIYRRTGTCYYLTDPEIYYSIRCNNTDLLHFAALKMKREFIDEFVNRYRTNINIQDNRGYTVYDYADLSAREIVRMLKTEKKPSRRKVLREELVLWERFKVYLIDEFNGKPCRAISVNLRRIKKCPSTAN